MTNEEFFEGAGITSNIKEDAPEENENISEDSETESQDYEESNEESSEDYSDYSEEDSEEGSDEDESSSIDEYGNKQKEKVYTQTEVNEMFRRRYKNNPEAMQAHDEFMRSQQSNPPEQQKKYSEDDWEAQLKEVIIQTVREDAAAEKQKAYQSEQAAIQAEQAAKQEAYNNEFMDKASKFNDFEDVVKGKISEAMYHAASAASNPAAFIYAACKRAPQEVERIRGIENPIAQMVEFGKLEEKMKTSKKSTKAPKPVSRSGSGKSVPYKSSGQSIEEKIAESNERRLKGMRGR
jgi:hypothetical protein